MAMEMKRVGTEVYKGTDICKRKSRELLTEVSLSKGLLPLDNLEECGIVREIGYVWMKQAKKVDHLFKPISKLIQYAPKVTEYVEKNRMKQLTGFKSKEFLLWVTISEISMNEKYPDSIYFKSSSMLGRALSLSAFQIEEDKEDGKAEK